MDALIIGYGSLVQRRILPALASLGSVASITIASRRAIASDALPKSKPIRAIQGYAEALSTAPPGLAYVSLPNNLHYEWSRRALSAGFHVVVDKPSCMDAREARDLAELARSSRLCCAEAITWQDHPMLELLRALRREGRPLAAAAHFSSPPLAAGNFRLVPAMGGGIIYDRASYAITCGREVFGGEPVDVACQVLERDAESSLDLSCRIGITYANGLLDAFLSLNAEYRNSVTITGESWSVDFDRVFTPPDDFIGPAIVRRQGKPEAVATRAGNAFALFLGRVIDAISAQSFDAFGERMVEDAVILDRILASANGGRA